MESKDDKNYRLNYKLNIHYKVDQKFILNKEDVEEDEKLKAINRSTYLTPKDYNLLKEDRLEHRTVSHRNKRDLSILFEAIAKNKRNTIFRFISLFGTNCWYNDEIATPFLMKKAIWMLIPYSMYELCPIRVCIYNDFIHLIPSLLEEKADPNRTSVKGKNVFNTLLKYSFPDKFQVVKLLIEYKANVIVNGFTDHISIAIKQLCLNCNPKEDLPIIQLLLNHQRNNINEFGNHWLKMIGKFPSSQETLLITEQLLMKNNILSFDILDYAIQHSDILLIRLLFRFGFISWEKYPPAYKNYLTQIYWNDVLKNHIICLSYSVRLLIVTYLENNHNWSSIEDKS